MSKAERELLKLAKAGDREAFEMLFLPHYEKVHRVARGLLRDDHHAQDAAQATYMKALEALAGYRGDAKPQTWLLSICWNHCRDLMRKRREWSLDALLAKAPDGSIKKLAFDPCPAWDSEIDFRAALAGLTLEEREAWFLAEMMDYTSEYAAEVVAARTSEDAAEVVAARPSTVRSPRPSTLRSRLNRARKQLASALGVQPSTER